MCKTSLSLPQIKVLCVGLRWLVLSLNTVEKDMACADEDLVPGFTVTPL